METGVLCSTIYLYVVNILPFEIVNKIFLRFFEIVQFFCFIFSLIAV